MRRGSPAVSLPSPRTFASLGFWPMIKLCPEGRPLMEERETSKAFSGHMVLQWQIRTQVPLKIQPVFSTWHLLSSGPESTSNKQNEIFHSPIVLKTKAPQEERAASNTRPAPPSWYLPDFSSPWRQSQESQTVNLWRAALNLHRLSWMKIQLPEGSRSKCTWEW